jgi:hypothetical protein
MDEIRAPSSTTLPCRRLTRPVTPAICMGMLLFAGCLQARDPSGTALSQVPTAAKVDEFFIVDCLLPPQIRQLGREVTYVTRRQAIKTSARD